MTLTRADIAEFSPEELRDTAACYGLDCDDLSDDQVFAEFSDYLDGLEVMHGE